MEINFFGIKLCNGCNNNIQCKTTKECPVSIKKIYKKFGFNLIEKFKKLDKYTQTAIIIIILGIIIRFAITLFVYPSGDSCKHLAVARFIAEFGRIPLYEFLGEIPVLSRPILFHLIAALFYKMFLVFGEHVALKSMNFVNPIFGSLTLIVFYLFVKDLINKKIALYSLIFLTFIPIHMYYSTISHVDATIIFFVITTLYLLHKKKFYLSAIFCGLGLFTKYSMLFLFPLIIFLIFRENKNIQNFIKKLISYFAITFIIGLPWYIRNAYYFGNPFYPLLNPFFASLGFHPFQLAERMLIHTGGLYNMGLARLPHHLLTAYLDLFGVPLGLTENLSYFPFRPYSLIAWGIITLIFFLPLIIGIFLRKPWKVKWILWIWILSYIIMMIIFLLDWPDFFLRLFLPALPALAIIWGYGFNKIFSFSKNLKLKKIIWFSLIICIIIFVVAEFVKVEVAAGTHKKYVDDFKWLKENIPEDALMVPSSGGLTYYSDRANKPILDLIPYNQSKVYYWVNKKFKGTLPENTELIYESSKTEVKIYKYTDS
ncbi:MAG: glycosyltransferase family 39 protein [Nanoarchaeota archaeon]|nr:glycosyltransferase family 39 protein [Nanoarchaeota archaeon]